MRPSLTLTLALAAALLVGCTGSGGTATTSPAPLGDIGAGLQGPSGLAASVYATGLANVSALAVDADGRLWAATASYSDTGADAVYRIGSPGAAPTQVISGIHMPLGLAWVGDTLYVSSAGRIEAYSGLGGAAFATVRTVVTLPAGAGEVNGLAVAADGRLVFGVSAPCNACTTTSTTDAAVLSVLPDGTGLQVVASGIRAPVGLAYVPGTTDLLVTMNQRDDLGEATPGDWLSIVRPGQKWGFPDCYGQGGTVCSGVPAPLAVLDPHAAVSGVAVVAGSLGPTIGTSALVAEWTTGKVMRVALTVRDGATTAASASGSAVSTFLSGLKQPVPVITAPDGALLVGDWGTGTVYRVAAVSAASAMPG